VWFENGTPPASWGGAAQTHLKRVVAVASDTFVNRKQEKVQAVLVPLVKQLHDVRQYGGVCARRYRRTVVARVGR